MLFSFRILCGEKLMSRSSGGAVFQRLTSGGLFTRRGPGLCAKLCLPNLSSNFPPSLCQTAGHPIIGLLELKEWWLSPAQDWSVTFRFGSCATTTFFSFTTAFLTAVGSFRTSNCLRFPWTQAQVFQHFYSLTIARWTDGFPSDLSRCL